MSSLLVCCHESVISLEEVSKTKCSKWHEETIVKIEETDIVRNELYIKVSTDNSDSRLISLHSIFEFWISEFISNLEKKSSSKPT